jgi:predicted nucleotide-binding protein
MTISPAEKSTVFIGSSTEGLKFAQAIRGQLRDDAEVTVWNEGFFKPSSTFIETLVSKASQFDFAIIVLSPDDVIKSRNDEILGPRDNVIFELGIFMGRLGRERTFIVEQENANVKIPTDLSGVVRTSYEWPRRDNEPEGAVGFASDLIRTVIRRLGSRSTRQLQQVTQEQQRQAGEINVVKLMLTLVLPEYERQHLVGLANPDKEFMVEIHRDSAAIFKAELQHLLSLQLVEIVEGTHLDELFRNEGKRDLKEFLKIKDRGKEYLEVYQKLQAIVS